jgi:two-component system, LytTR family, response regulator
MTSLRVVIVDDEPLARERMRLLVHGTPDLQLVGEGSDGLQGLDLVARLEPDVILLDVEMPELDGMELIAALDVRRIPAVVLVTAFEHYALAAFDVGAVDFLHKPVTAARFAAAMARARERLEHRSAAAWRAVVDSAAVAGQRHGARSRFVVRVGAAHHFVPVEQVDWIEAADNYLQLHVGSRTHLVRGTLQQAQAELDPARFVRIHRSTLVAVDRIVTLRAAAPGAWQLVLRDGTTLRASRSCAARVRALLRE